MNTSVTVQRLLLSPKPVPVAIAPANTLRSIVILNPNLRNSPLFSLPPAYLTKTVATKSKNFKQGKPMGDTLCD